jgi:hypothetical protein
VRGGELRGWTGARGGERADAQVRGEEGAGGGELRKDVS